MRFQRYFYAAAAVSLAVAAPLFELLSRPHAVYHQIDRRFTPALAQCGFVQRPRARRHHALHIQITHHQDQRLRSGKMRIEIVAHLAKALPFGQENNQSLDGGRKRHARTRALAKQCDDLRVARQKLELGLECEAQTFEWPAGRQRGSRQRIFELGGGLGEDGLEESALGVVVVEQQLLVDARASGDLLNSRPCKASPSELVARGEAYS